jgi:hypothetical protein
LVHALVPVAGGGLCIRIGDLLDPKRALVVNSAPTLEGLLGQIGDVVG